MYHEKCPFGKEQWDILMQQMKKCLIDKPSESDSDVDSEEEVEPLL